MFFDQNLPPFGFGDYSYKYVFLKKTTIQYFMPPLPLLKILDSHSAGGVMWRMTKRSCMDLENERAEWMWRLSEKNIYLHLAKKCFYVFLFVLI